MMKLMSMHLDVVDEVLGGNLEKFAEIVDPLSDSVKVGYIPSPEEQQEREEKDFALVLFHPHVGTLNKYATYTSELTELNMAYLAKKHGNLPDEIVKTASTNLAVAANKYSLELPEVLSSYIDNSDSYINNIVDVRDIDEVDFFGKTDKVAEVSEYAWPKEEKYPLGTEENVKKACAYFDRYNSEMEAGKKLEYAVNTQISANSLEMSIGDSAISKYASLSRELFNPEFYNHITIRQSYLQDSDNEALDLYSELLHKSDDFGPVKTAEVLYEIDKKADMIRNYGHGVEDPLLASLKVPTDREMMIDGTLIKQSSLKKLSSESLTQLIGNDVISELKGDEGLDILNSLPKPIREEIINAI